MFCSSQQGPKATVRHIGNTKVMPTQTPTQMFCTCNSLGHTCQPLRSPLCADEPAPERWFSKRKHVLAWHYGILLLLEQNVPLILLLHHSEVRTLQSQTNHVKLPGRVLRCTKTIPGWLAHIGSLIKLKRWILFINSMCSWNGSNPGHQPWSTWDSSQSLCTCSSPSEWPPLHRPACRKHWDEEGPYRVTMKHYIRTPGAYGKTSRFTTKCLINWVN